MFGRAKQKQPALQPATTSCGTSAGEDAAARVSRLRASFALPFVSAPHATAAAEVPAGVAATAAGGTAGMGAKRAVEQAVGDGGDAAEEAEEGGREEPDEAATTREGAQPCCATGLCTCCRALWQGDCLTSGPGNRSADSVLGCVELRACKGCYGCRSDMQTPMHRHERSSLRSWSLPHSQLPLHSLPYRPHMCEQTSELPWMG